MEGVNTRLAIPEPLLNLADVARMSVRIKMQERRS